METVRIENTIHFFPNNNPNQHSITSPCHCDPIPHIFNNGIVCFQHDPNNLFWWDAQLGTHNLKVPK